MNHLKTIWLWSSVIFAAMSISSCKITTVPLKSTTTLPSSYSAAPADTLDVASSPWQLFFQDSLLRGLIDVALSHNFDERIAAERINLSGAVYNMSSRNFLPSVDLVLGNTTRKFAEYTMDDVGNKDTNKSDNVPPDKRIPSPYGEWSTAVTFQWEADIWGKLAARRKAAAARYLASTEFHNWIRTRIISELATTYFELIGLDQERKVLHENLTLQELGLELIKIQKIGGRVNQLAVDQFEAQLLDIKNQIALATQRIMVAEAYVNQLLGRFPQAIARDSLSHYPGLQLHIGRPRDLLQLRPDIRQAELELAESHWDVNAARAAFYPSISFSGSAGLASFDASKLLNIPGSTAFSLAGSMLTPIFQRHRIRAQYAAAGSRQKVALASYEKKIIESYHEVYTTIAWIDNLNDRIELKNSEVGLLQRAFNNSNDLFSVGYATYLEVITAQRRMLETELALTRLKKEELKARAILYRALGGGWR